MNAIEEMCKSILCLHLEASAGVMKDVEAKWRDVLFVLEKKDRTIEDLREVIRLYEKKHAEYEADIGTLKELDELRKIRDVYQKIKPIVEAGP